MSATNKTTHYELPVFLGSDKPAWLVDWNGAMAAIDAAIYEAYTTAQSASTAASSVASDLATLSGTVSTQGTSISTLTDTLTTLVGTVNTITSLIGNGVPTTTDKTIIGAINEINAKIPEGGTTAAGVSYDNTASGLTADDVQEAIDELKDDIDAISPVVTNRRVIFTADSYGTWNDGELATKLETALNLGAGNFYDFCYRSMGFSQAGGGGGDPELTAIQYFQAHASDVSSPSTITDIIVTLGLNDCVTDYSSVEESNVTTFINYLKLTYPNAKIHYGFIGNNIGAATTTDVIADNYYNMIGLITRVFRDAGCIIIDGVEYIMHNALNMEADWIHPNPDGCTELSDFITKHMNGLNPKYQKIYTFVNSIGQKAQIIIDGAITTLKCIDYASVSTGQLIQGGFTKFFELTGSAIRGTYPQNKRAFYPAFFVVSSSTVVMEVCIGNSGVQVYSPTSGTFTGIAALELSTSTLTI